ncbi:hypothetical protein Tco_1018082 [Tanacetum coccineum]|uniref:Uncharacterized protein n=1 Tax=Tanacetum coccineum TaxID=301880 RepID=A0ABQ5FTA0_9ASTR
MSKKQAVLLLSSSEAEYVCYRSVVAPSNVDGNSMNVYKGRMPTKIELTLEQSQQGVSNDVLELSFKDISLSREIVQQAFKMMQSYEQWSRTQDRMVAKNVAFVSTPSSTNDVNTSNVLVNTASSSLSTASSTDNTTRLNDATIYAFLAN